jgi:hypothetical protein
VLEDQPVCLGGVFLVGLSFEDANELMDVLNRQDLEIERTARRLVAEAMRPRSQGFKPLPARPSWTRVVPSPWSQSASAEAHAGAEKAG